MNPGTVNDFLKLFHPTPPGRALTRSARHQRLPCRAMTTKKPSKGGSKSRSQAPNKGPKAGAARTAKPGKPLPGWFPELNEGGTPPRGRKVRSADAAAP
ncbi:ribonuclease R, partial [Stenotrophomonas maltophilia]|nr:ribonuclease R [Stenotrophomonas maltophilia]